MNYSVISEGGEEMSAGLSRAAAMAMAQAHADETGKPCVVASPCRCGDVEECSGDCGASGETVEPEILDATDVHMETIRHQRVDDTARDMMRRGVRLSWEQEESLGAIERSWLHRRLGLSAQTDDQGVTYSPVH